MTDPLGQSQVLPYIKGLTKHGYEFHLISFEKPDRFEQHKKHIHSICDDSGIHWHPQDYIHKGGPLGTIGLVKRMKKVTMYLHSIHNFQIVHCRSYIPALVGLKFKSMGLKFIFDMRGFWADERVDGGLWNLKKPIFKTIYGYFKRKEKEFIKKADCVISLTDNGKNEMLSWPTTNPNTRIEIIPCCANLDLFDKSTITDQIKSDCRNEVGLKNDDFVIGYIGSIGTWYMLPEMLDYFKVLKKSKSNSKFLFVSGEKPERIKSMATDKGIDPNDIKVISVLHHRVPHFISLMDASIFFIRASYSKKASSPTKQGEIMAMGVPLICNSNVGDTDLIVEKYQSGIVIDTFDNTTYESNIIDPAQFDTVLIAEGAKDYFSLEEGVKRFLNVYESVSE